jgi:putative DNA primase/helicase
MAKHAIRLRQQAAAEVGDDDERRKEIAWALQSESASRLEAMIKLARSEKPLADDGSKWDADPLLLAVANGVVDLRTGKLRTGRPEDLITLHSGIAFDARAKCSRFERFVDEIFEGDADLITYVQRAIGYALSGDTSEQCFFCCCGEGANGKSTFLNAIRYVLSDYACNLPFSAFELNARSTIPNDIAMLPSRRFATAIETDETAVLNAARIKALTGGDPITARSLYKDHFTFTPVAKFFLAFNHRPRVTDDSHGFWRRVHMIPFNRRFDVTVEPDLAAKLRAEAPGILAWAVRGCLEWQKRGLVPPVSVTKSTDAYREESDPVTDFIDDRCVLHQDAKVGVSALWEAYLEYCMAGDQPGLARPEFTRRIERLGCRKVRAGHDRDWIWLGICRKQDTEGQNFPPAADVRADADVNLK